MGVKFVKTLSRYKKRMENHRRMFTSSMKRRIRRFHVVVVQWTSKKCTEKRDVRVELLSCS